VVKTVQGSKTTFAKRPRAQEELNKIQQLAQAAIGFDPKRGDTISVQNMSFEGTAGNSDLPAAGWATQVEKTVSDYSSILRPISLLLLFVRLRAVVARGSAFASPLGLTAAGRARFLRALRRAATRRTRLVRASL